MDVNTAYQVLTNNITEVIDIFAPLQTVTLSKKKYIRDPWITKGIRKSSLTLDKLYKKKLRQPPEHLSHTKYRSYRNLINRVKRSAKQKYFSDLLEKHKNSIKHTWRVLKPIIGQTKDQNDISDNFMIDSTRVDDTNRIANEFNSYFANVGPSYASQISQTQTCSEHFFKNKTKDSLCMYKTDPCEVSDRIKSMKTKKSVGHDGITSELIKMISDEVSTPILVIINRSIDEGTVPEAMKLAEVVPIYKNKEKNLFKNYRPISLLPTVSKILEKVIHKRLYGFLNAQKFFYSSQYGFRKNHATIDAAAEFMTFVLNAIEEKSIL